MKEQMSEQDYRKAKGLNYSAISAFYQSQDHALMGFSHKSYFEEGKIFEIMLQDACTNSELFNAKYFHCTVPGSMPDNLISLIDSGADLNNEYKYNKDGVTLSGTYKNKHAYLDACLEHGKGLYPINSELYDMMSTLVNNMLKTEVLGVTVFDILSRADWQVPVFWTKDGIAKKALFDCVLNLDGETYLFDVKSAANQYQFSKMAHSKYWIQEKHYSEAAEHEWGNVKSFTFLVAYKEPPFLCQPVTIEGDRQQQYDDLCKNYLQWIEDDKPSRGFLPEKVIQLRNL